jgi:hypothetical protein
LRFRRTLSYRRIKRGFGFDDDALEDLRRELIGTLRVASDRDGELLAWAARTRSAQADPSALPTLLAAARLAEGRRSLPRAICRPPSGGT